MSLFETQETMEGERRRDERLTGARSLREGVSSKGIRAGAGAYELEFSIGVERAEGWESEVGDFFGGEEGGGWEGKEGSTSRRSSWRDRGGNVIPLFIAALYFVASGAQ